MLLINADLSVAWCEPELAEFLGHLNAGSLLAESKHPVVHAIQRLDSLKTQLSKPSGLSGSVSNVPFAYRALGSRWLRGDSFTP